MQLFRLHRKTKWQDTSRLKQSNSADYSIAILTAVFIYLSVYFFSDRCFTRNLFIRRWLQLGLQEIEQWTITSLNRTFCFHVVSFSLENALHKRKQKINVKIAWHLRAEKSICLTSMKHVPLPLSYLIFLPFCACRPVVKKERKTKLAAYMSRVACLIKGLGAYVVKVLLMSSATPEDNGRKLVTQFLR